MRISEFHVDGFGRLANLSMTDVAPGLSIVVGDNEAGKTTLLEFLRFILFGLPARRQREFYPPLYGGRKGGRLVLRNAQSERIIVERFEGKGYGPLTVTMPDGSTGGESEFRQLIGSATDDLYRSVFAFSLSELQSFESLNTEKVRDAIYSAGIGIGQRTITQVIQELTKPAGDLFAPNASKPPISQLLRRLEDHGGRIRSHEKDQDDYQRIQLALASSELSLQRLGTELIEARRRSVRLQILQQAWHDWIALGDCEEQLQSLPVIEAFPVDGVKRLDELCAGRRGLRDQMTQLAAQEETDKTNLTTIEVDQTILTAAQDIRRVDRGLEVYEKNSEQLLSNQTERDLAERRLVSSLRDLGEEWNEKKLADFDLSIPVQEEIETCRLSCYAAKDATRDRQVQSADAGQEQDGARKLEAAALLQLRQYPQSSETLDVEGIRKLPLGRERYRGACHDLPGVEKQCETRIGHLVDTLRKIGPNWTESRLKDFDTSLAVQEEVSSHLKRLADLRSDQQETVRRGQEARQAFDDARADLSRAEEVLAAMPACEVTDEPELTERRRSLWALRSRLNDLQQHESRGTHLDERKHDLDAQVARMEKEWGRESFGLPAWMGPVVLAVGVMSLFLLVLGRRDWIAGGIVFGLSAIVALMLVMLRRASAARADQQRADQTQTINDLQSQGLELEREAKEIQQERAVTTAAILSQAQAAGFANLPDERALDSADGEVERSLAILQQRRPAEQRREDAQRNLTKSEAAQSRADAVSAETTRLLGIAQEEWRQWLAKAELPETLTPENAAIVLNRLDAAREQLKAIESDRERICQMQAATREYDQQVRSVAASSGFNTGLPEDAEAAADFLVARLQDHEEQAREAQEAARGFAEAEQRSAQANRKAEATRRSLLEAMDAEQKCQQQWKDLLKRLGLRDSLTVESAPQMLQAIERARDQLIQLHDLRNRERTSRESQASFCRDVCLVFDKVDCPKPADGKVREAVSGLASELERAEEGQRQLETFSANLQRLGTLAKGMERQIKQRQDEIDDLLRAADTPDEETFRRKAEDFAACRALEQQIRQRESRLLQLAGNADAVQSLKGELAHATLEDWESERAILEETIVTKEQQHTNAADERGRLKEQLEQLEKSDELSRLRIEQQADRAELEGNAAEWSVLRIAANLIDRAREKYERERRPGVLKEAERHFAHFTNGNYTEILAPAGGDQVVVLAPDGARKEIGQLSRGTAEQLYLSLRFGFIQAFAARSEPLPLVFDDILVNFDAGRACATAKAILELSKFFQILLFTCHASTVQLMLGVERGIPVHTLKDGRFTSGTS